MKINIPTEEQKMQLAKMLHLALLEIRSVASEGNAELAEDIADVFHNLPKILLGCGVWDLEDFRNNLEYYEQKYDYKSNEIFTCHIAEFDSICPDINKSVNR